MEAQKFLPKKVNRAMSETKAQGSRKGNRLTSGFVKLQRGFDTQEDAYRNAQAEDA
jgi:hypothetical protein